MLLTCSNGETPALAEEVLVAERRDKVMILRHKGLRYRDIAEECGVSLETVQSDFRAIRADWLRRIARHRAAWMADLLSDVEMVRRIALEDYLASDKPKRGDMVENSDKGTKRRRSRKEMRRDPRFLSIVLECDKHRAALLGMGDKTALDRADEILGKKRPKLLVIRDRQQASDLVDITKLMEIESLEPVQDGEVVDGQVIFPEGEGPQ